MALLFCSIPRLSVNKFTQLLEKTSAIYWYINILWMSFITSVDNSKLQDVKLQYQIIASVLQVVELCEASF